MIDAIIQKGIISPSDAYEIHEHCVFIDATFVLPTSDIDPFENFKEKQIRGARFFDIQSVANKNSNLPHMLPDSETFSNSMNKLGVHRNDFVIIYGQQGMIMGPARLWWMLRGFGHSKVVVLDGGLPAWIRSGYPVVPDSNYAIKETNYEASKFNSSSVLHIEDMEDISRETLCPILDARPASRFSGETPEPRAGMRSGHIPNSINLPCSALIDDSGYFRSESELLELFKDINLSGRVATTCGSGITACALALALYHIGHENVAVYDGSWSEWGREDSGTEIAR